MKLWVALLLADCVLVGIGLTYLTGLKLRIEERVAYGAVIGFMAVTLVGYAAAWAVGRLTGPVIVAAALVATAISATGWWTGIRQIGAECRDFRRRLMRPISRPENPAPLLILTAPAWAITTWILNQAYLPGGSGGVLAGHLSSWTDWQAHLTYASSFAHAENFPPELPTAFGVDRLPYHFGIDFFAAMLDRAGLSAFGGLEVSSGYLAFAFVPVLYLVGVRLFSSRAVGVTAVLVFTLFGGLGWLRFFGDVADGGWSIIWDLPTDYTRHHAGNILMENAVTGNLFPQRPTLAGFSLLLIVVVLMREAHKSGSRRLFAAVGVIVGLMPIFHVYSFGMALGLGLIWAVLAHRWKWLLFALPALAFSLPAALWIKPLNTEIVWETWVDGPWMQPPSYSVDHDNPFEFWWRNAGVFLLLMLAAQLWWRTMPRVVLWGSIPVWLWLIVPNFVRVAPSHPWNNTHWFVPVILLGSLLVAAVLVRLASIGWLGIVAAVALFFTLTFAGALDIWKAVDPEVNVWPHPIASGDGVAAGEWVRDNTPPDSVFLIGFEHTHPVPALSGRQTVVGFGGWINDLGVTDWHSRQHTARTMLGGLEGTENLLDDYGVDYVVVGPIERRVGVSEQFWAARGTPVFAQGSYTVYEVN
ncbi:hypothetical protein [Candidatus Poriferisocius sp.]|uniref:hypothetical protein n=1 Tax=Candidatus Poriferisocius sp. TaxID=3101276 RepID=UPI003B028599